MSLSRADQSRQLDASLAQFTERASDSVGRWLKTSEAAEYARFDSGDGFAEWAPTVHVVPIRRGRILLWDRRDIDAALERLKWAPVSSAASRSGEQEDVGLRVGSRHR